MSTEKKLDPVAAFLSHAMRDTDKSNREIAIALGYDEKRANFISMIRLGQAKLPLDKVVLLAEKLVVLITTLTGYAVVSAA